MAGQGTEPKWNENFLFTISDGITELKLRILDSDLATCDDIVGEATWVPTGLHIFVKVKIWNLPKSYFTMEVVDEK